jgi:hypothetical protein
MRPSLGEAGAAVLTRGGDGGSLARAIQDRRSSGRGAGVPPAGSAATTERSAMRTSILLAAVLAAVLAGCGGGPEPNLVEIQGDEYAFVMPATVEGGWTTLRLENTGEEPHEFALAKVRAQTTLADVREVLADPATQEQGPPEWLEIRAGIPTLAKGETAALTQRLEPGRYALICFLDGPEGRPHFADGMLGLVDVEGTAGAEAPEADATLALGKALAAPELDAGERTLELRNATDEPNAVFLVSFAPGKTDEDLVAWEEGGMKGPAPGSFHGGAIDVPPHSSVYYTYTFEHGVDYALIDDANGVERRFRVR